MRPIAIPPYISSKYYLTQSPEKTCNDIKLDYQHLQKGPIQVSVVIPAYNEENNILRTLSSLASNQSKWSVEIIVVNNNSKDRTKELVEAAGVTCILETVQRISAARNAGLNAANGKFILTADADTIYPENWIDLMIEPLETQSGIALCYGRFAHIPTANTPRLVYFFYEYITDFNRWFNKTFREEAVNVYGFNSCYRKAEGLAVDSYNFPAGAAEDGWLALKLREKGFGKLYQVTHPLAMVWTTDRRMQKDGGLLIGIFKRLKKMLGFSQELRTDV